MSRYIGSLHRVSCFYKQMVGECYRFSHHNKISFDVSIYLYKNIASVGLNAISTISWWRHDVKCFAHYRSFGRQFTMMESTSVWWSPSAKSQSCGDLVFSSLLHYCDAIMGTVTSQITSLTIVYIAVYSDADQSKHQSSASLAFVCGIHRGPVNSPHKWPVTR